MDGRQQIEEIFSWRLVTELWRRFPDRFMLLEMHPCDGQYDCLTLWDRRNDKGVLLHVNRGASLHVEPIAGSSHKSWPDWTDRLLGTSPTEFLDEVISALGLEPPQRLPRSTATTITYRFISEFLTHTIGRIERWECRHGFEDTSGWGGGKRQEWFAKFPDLAQHPKPRRYDDLSFAVDYYHWFLVKDGKPMLCLNTDGLVISKTGDSHELLPLYRNHNRMWTVITAVVGDLLP